MFRRLLLTLSREMPSDSFAYQINYPITTQIKNFTGGIPDDWSNPVGPIVLGNTFGLVPYAGPIPPPPPPKPRPSQ